MLPGAAEPVRQALLGMHVKPCPEDVDLIIPGALVGLCVLRCRLDI